MDRDLKRRQHATKDVDDPRAHAAPGKTTLVERVMRKADANGVHANADEALALASSSSGTPLPETLQRKFESSLGADLSGVRVHTGGESAAAARSISARAYTTGNDVHFGAGQFNPHSAEGEHLLAHEVAHTVQQSGAAPSTQARAEVSAPEDGAELEADRAADRMVAGAPAPVSRGASGAHRRIMRDPAPPAPAPDVNAWLPERDWSTEAAPGEQDATAMTQPWQFTPVNRPREELAPSIADWAKEHGASIPPGASAKGALDASWSAFVGVGLATQSAWNGAVPAIQEYLTTVSGAEPKLRTLNGLDGVGKGDVADLASDQRVAGTNVSVRRAFGGVHSDLSGGPVIKGSELPDTTRKEIEDLHGDLTQQTGAVGASKDKLHNFVNLVDIQVNTADSALAGVQISQKEYEQAQYEQEVRNLQAAKTAVTGAVNGITSIAKGFATGAVSVASGDAKGMASGFGDMIGGGGKLVETGVGLGFDIAINNVYAKIVAAKGAINSLKIQQGFDAIKNAIDAAANAVTDGREYYANVYLKAVNDRKKTIANFAAKLQEAASKSGAGEETIRNVGAAIKALPIVEEVVRALEKVTPLMVEPPAYTPESGRGANLCVNAGDVVQHVAILRGVKRHLAASQSVWEGRLKVIETLIQQSR
jgi:Domain of unknown function (DUF4157)